MPIAEILPLTLFADIDLRGLAHSIERQFHMEVAVKRATFDISEALDTARNQYFSTRILSLLLKHGPQEADRVLALTDLDLFIPILTFVFGEAQVNGRVCVASACRLRPEFYGLPPNPQLLADRVVKEVSHELAHTFGLLHCPNTTCVLHPSPSVERVDLKGAALCTRCQRELNGKMAMLKSST